MSIGALAGAAAWGQQPDGATIVQYADQGWTTADRATFYGTGQGSHLIPYAWFKALRRLDVDEPFGADQLQRYGYLPNDEPGNAERLPIGFVVEGSPQQGMLGMTCAACHTGQVEYLRAGRKVALRIDGAPAMAEFYQFLSDLRAAALATVEQPARFDAFARAVLGGSYTAAAVEQLEIGFGGWARQFKEIMDASLPQQSWGPGRLDAFGMIFNRVGGRDLGLPKNFHVADAPVSYPYLWNASRQDKTQWTGSVPNGLYIEALARNAGQVLGVFADFKPEKSLMVVRFGNNSVDFAGLQTLEEKIATLRPPRWPRDAGDDFRLDDGLARRGAELFGRHCGRCHAPSPDPTGRWLTLVQAVGTDPRMWLNADRKIDPGLFKATPLPLPSIGIYEGGDKSAKASDVLASSVVGVILDQAARLDPLRSDSWGKNGMWRAIDKDLSLSLPAEKGPLSGLDLLARIDAARTLLTKHLVNLFRKPSSDVGAYKARVLQGIWATAPYLHNGSVPNLWELLQPPHKRTTVFMVGSRTFDPRKVGFATDSSPFGSGTFNADPGNANGNGNLGHDYGSDLSDAERWALIEYLKTL